MFFWNSLAFSMIQQMLAIWSLVPLPFLKPGPIPPFKSINSSVLSFLYSPTLTSIHDYWKIHSFDWMDLCWQNVEWQITSVFLPGESHEQRNLAGYSPWDHKSRTRLSAFFLSFSFLYGCECWTVKKAECQRIDDFELWCWRRLLRVPWTQISQS